MTIGVTQTKNRTDVDPSNNMILLSSANFLLSSRLVFPVTDHYTHEFLVTFSLSDTYMHQSKVVFFVTQISYLFLSESFRRVFITKYIILGESSKHPLEKEFGAVD